MSQRFDAPPPRQSTPQRNDAPPNSNANTPRNDVPPNSSANTPRYDMPPNSNANTPRYDMPPNDSANNPSPDGNNRQPVLIVLIVSITAVVIAGLVLIGVIIVNSGKEDTPVPAQTTQAVATTIAATTEPETEQPETEEPETEKPTQKATEPPTESNVYHNVGYGWSVEIPDEWNEYGWTVEANYPNSDREGYLNFYHKEIYQTAKAGFVMSIYAIDKSNTKYNRTNGWMNKGGFLGENDRFYFFWEGPTDVQWIVPEHSNRDDPEYQRLEQEWRTLQNISATIRDSFKVDE